MNTAGILPRLVSSDPVSTIKNYSEALASKLEGGAGWTSLTLGTGWTAVSGFPLQARKFGKLVEIRGLAKFTSGTWTSTIMTLPLTFRPSGQPIWLSASVGTVSKVIVTPYVNTSGTITLTPTYSTAAATVNDTFAIRGVWHTDITP